MNTKGYAKVLGIGLAAVLPILTLLLGAERASAIFPRADNPLSTSTGVDGVTQVAQASGPSLIVATTNDEWNANGVCSLREAIINANHDDQSGSTDCAAGSGADTITFSLSGTITVGSNLPHITSQMIIDGAGQLVTLNGNDAVRVFYVESSGSLMLNMLTVKNGNAGSGQGGGIYNGGGVLTVNNCTLSNNKAAHGGGIFNYGNGRLTITNSTLSGNFASSYGGGIANYENSTLTMANSTLSGNSAGWGGGIDNSSSTITMTHCTLSGNSAGNGGGIHSYSGPVYLAATVLDTGDRGANCYGSITDSCYNLSDDGSCGLGGTGSRADAALNLGALAANGGPTQTHLPGEGSAAIDLIPSGKTLSNNGVGYTCDQNAEPLDHDQRGEPRPAGGSHPLATSGACDAGASETGDLPATLALTSPDNGSTIANRMLTFDWEDTAGATQYQIQVDDNADFSSPVLGMIVITSSYTFTTTLPAGTYYWYVRAGAVDVWGATSETRTVSLVEPPGAPILEFPPNGSTTSADILSFVWRPSAGATQYQIQVDDNVDFSSPVVDTVVPTPAYGHQAVLPNATYYWRVRAGGNAWGDYGSAWAIIYSRLPSTPNLLSPANNSVIPGSPPIFDWDDMPGAVQYQIQVDDSADFSSPVIDAAVPASAYVSASPLPGGIYHWRVRAASSVWGDFSSALAVTVAAAADNTCSIDLFNNTHDCGNLPAISFVVAPAGGQTVMRLNLIAYNRVRFDVTYHAAPTGWTVNIGDSATNDGYAGDGRTQANDAELQIVDQSLTIYANDYGGSKALQAAAGFVQGGQRVSFTISNDRVDTVNGSGSAGVLDAPSLFALAGQADREGPVNDDIYAAFNRVIGSSSRAGTGVSQVVVTLIP